MTVQTFIILTLCVFIFLIGIAYGLHCWEKSINNLALDNRFYIPMIKEWRVEFYCNGKLIESVIMTTDEDITELSENWIKNNSFDTLSYVVASPKYYEHFDHEKD